jgi:uncharacterized protein involved in propanediol utilization
MKIIQFTLNEAQNQLPKLLQATSEGQEVIITANFVQAHHKYGKMKKLKEVNEIWQHIR